MIQEEYDGVPGIATISILRFSMFISDMGRFACFRGQATETHGLLMVLPGLLELLDDGSLHHTVRLKAARSLLRIHRIFAENNLFLSDEAAAEALECADDFLMQNNFLLQKSLEKGFLLYHMVSKTHFMWHITFFAKWQNPRWAACFEFEDMMGKIKLCAQNAMAGTSLALMGSKCLEHLLLHLHLRLGQLGCP